MNRLRTVSLLVAVALAIPAQAADTISIGSGVASRPQIDVGVFVSDNAGSTLNVTDAPDRRIQSLGFKIDFSPSSAVASISITRAGVTASLTPLFESTPSTATSASYIASFSQPIPFTLNGGDQIANVSITFSSSAAAGSTITLTLDPNATALSNQGGTIEETALNGQLTLGNGSVSIAVPQFSMTGAQSILFGSEATLTVQMGSGQGTDVVVATSSSSPNVSVPASVTIPAGQTSATFAARGENVGNATVTATLPQSQGGATASLSINVAALALTLDAGPAALGVGENRSASVSVNGAGAVPINITLSSSNPAVASVPPAVQIAAGQTSVPFTVTGGTAGSATITATLPAPAGGGTASAEFNVVVFTAPSAPSGPQPADGSVDVPAPVFLSWSGQTGVQSYDVYFGTAENPLLLTMTTSPGVGVITSPGVRYFWRIVAKNPAGEATSPVWSFTVRTSTGCVTPSAPSLSAPVSIPASQSYTVSWSAVSGATEYQVEESNDPNFAVKSATTVSAPATTAAFTHAASTDITFYYRVRARSTGASCDETGAFSTIATVVVRGTAGPALRIIPAVASGPGANSSFFRTSVQLHNPGSTAISGRFVFHAAGRSGSDDDPKLNYTLGPRESRSYSDIVSDMSQSGLGSLDLFADFGALPRAVVRVFNDAATNGTSGSTQPLIDPADALKAGSTGVLIAPVDTRSARFNIGVRTLGEPAVITFNLISRTGAQMTQVTRDYPATFFEQRIASDLLGVSPGDSDVIEIKVVSGRAIVYGSTTDNITQDPSLQVETQP